MLLCRLIRGDRSVPDRM